MLHFIGMIHWGLLILPHIHMLHASPVAHFLSGVFEKPPSPMTGKPRFSSSLVMTFHRPTIFSLSIGVTLLLYTLTLGRDDSSPRLWISSTSFFGLGALII